MGDLVPENKNELGTNLLTSVLSETIKFFWTTVFLRRNTAVTELEKIKAGKYKEVSDKLLEEGKMSHMEYFKCTNFLKVAELADQELRGKEKTSEKKQEFDWFVRFYDYASSVSNETLQSIWAKILAAQIQYPGNVSYALLFALSMMDQEQAAFFNNISRFAWRDKEGLPNLFLFVRTNRNAYAASGITPSKLKALERLGLLECDFKDEFIFRGEKVLLTGNREFRILGDEKNERRIRAGDAKFTTDGVVLYSAVSDTYKMYDPKIADFIVTKFKLRNCRVFCNDREI